MKFFLKWIIYITAFTFFFGAAGYFSLSFLIKRSKTVTVPDLKGRDVVSALRVLSEMGLITRISGLEPSSDLPKDTVISQDPPPGARIKKGREVKVIISSGPGFVTVPDLTRMPVRQAEIALEKIGLAIGKISAVHSSSFDKSTIIAQFPDAGSRVEQNEKVDLLKSLGAIEEKIKMPDLTGLALKDAIDIIKEAGLKLEKIEYTSYKDHPTGVVLRQRPLAGYPSGSGEGVSLVVNRLFLLREYEPAEKNEDFDFISITTDFGFLQRRILVTIRTEDNFASLFYDGYEKPGDRIWLLLPRSKGGSAQLLIDDRPFTTKRYKKRR